MGGEVRKNAREFAGKKINLLYVLREGQRDKRGARTWDCICECGKRLNINTANLPKQKSCGCHVAKKLGDISRIHGYFGTPTHNAWESMRGRCLYPSHKSYFRYGGAGIGICPEWSDFRNFLADMGERPEGATLDRIDNSKGYCKENCRWATFVEQANNRSNNRIVEFDGQSLTIAQWSRLVGTKECTIAKRLDSGWSVQDSLYKPIRTDSRHRRQP